MVQVESPYGLSALHWYSPSSPGPRSSITRHTRPVSSSYQVFLPPVSSSGCPFHVHCTVGAGIPDIIPTNMASLPCCTRNPWNGWTHLGGRHGILEKLSVSPVAKALQNLVFWWKEMSNFGKGFQKCHILNSQIYVTNFCHKSTHPHLTFQQHLNVTIFHWISLSFIL